MGMRAWNMSRDRVAFLLVLLLCVSIAPDMWLLRVATGRVFVKDCMHLAARPCRALVLRPANALALWPRTFAPVVPSYPA
ncbi:hypothetical protein C8R45DRAFT_989460 [Mycena sanguinolenta]|nr:hypothetical protein C8R45DRAFT_989460 [Mycena sanguinolenta]